MFKFFKENWILIFVLFLMAIMSIPLLYFGNLLKILSHENSGAGIIDDSKPPVIGVCLNSLMETRWLKEQAAMMEEAGNQGLTVKIKVAHHSLSRQISQIAGFINSGVKVLVVNPVSDTGLKDILEKAKSNGIKIIQYDELTAGPLDLFVSVDYREIGRTLALSIMQNTGPGNYLIIRGPQNSYKAGAIYQGIRDLTNKMDIYKKSAVTVSLLSTWSADEAVNKTRIFAARQRINAILTPNDLIAGEIAAFMKEQKQPLPGIVGAGAEVAACQRILSGDQVATIYVDYQLMAKIAVIHGKELWRRQTPSVNYAINVNGRDIPTRLLPIYLITRDNLKTLLVDQFKVYTEQDLSSE